jgi:hypothetical protein
MDPMNPNATLEILRYHVEEFRKTFDRVDHPERYATTPGADNHMIDTAETVVEAFGALDDIMSRGATMPDDWDWTS